MGGFSQRKTVRKIRGMMQKHMPLMITCREFEDFILAYFEGELSSKQKFVFELHLKVCRECRDYLAAYQQTMDIVRLAASDDTLIPDDVPEDLINAIIEARDA